MTTQNQTPSNEIAAVQEYIQTMLPWAHGHQVKGLTDYILAILEHPTGNQAALVRGMGNQEAALKRLTRLTHQGACKVGLATEVAATRTRSRPPPTVLAAAGWLRALVAVVSTASQATLHTPCLTHNERLTPRKLADSVLAHAIAQLPAQGKVRLAMDWTIEGSQYLLTISLVIRGRAVPIYWRAYCESALKGRMRLYEVAMFKRVLTRLGKSIRLSRLRVTADRGFADVELMDLLDSYGIFYVVRVRATTQVLVQGEWCQLQTLHFTTNARRRQVGHVPYCKSNPHTVWVSLSRVKNETGQWDVWYLVSNHYNRPGQMAAEYARRFGCEQGFRDVKWLLGFAEARIEAIEAWSRFFTLFVIALLLLVSLGTVLLALGKPVMLQLLRRIASRRRGRWEVSLVNAMLLLVQNDPGLWQWFDPQCTLNLEVALPNVS